MGVLTGLEDFITESIVKVDSPLTILPADGNVLILPDSLIDKINELPSVRKISPFIRGEAIVRLPSRKIDYGCRIMGIAPDSDFLENAMTSERSYGPTKLLTEDGENGIIMGIYLADHFYHASGDTVYIFPPAAFFSSRGGAVGKAVILGAVETGLPVNDENLAWIPLELAQRIYLPRGGYSGFNLYPADDANIEHVITELETLLPETAIISTWQEQNPGLTASMKLERMGAFLAILLITLVATFNIMGTISRTAVERRVDISVLKAMGAQNKLIFRIFLWEGVLVGTIGVLFGLCIGLGGCWILGSTDFIQLPDVYSFHEHIPVSTVPMNIILISTIAFVLSALSGIIPAMKAAKLNPLKGLQG